MAIYDEILKRIKEEIVTDPDNIGYAGKTDTQMVDLLNSPYDVPVTTFVGRPSPLNKILSGLTGAGNLITIKEVTDAKKLIT